MSDETETVVVRDHRYRNVSGHPEETQGGRVVGYLGDDSYVFFSGDELKDEFNKAKIENGTFMESPEPETPEPTLEELKARAQELDISGRSSMNKVELQQAIATEEAAQTERGDG